MGRDKALLPFKGRTLVECVAAEVHAVTHAVTVVGNISRHSYLSYPVIEDVFPGRGPLSGIHAALTASRAEWNLIVACDITDGLAGLSVDIWRVPDPRYFHNLNSPEDLSLYAND